MNSVLYILLVARLVIAVQLTRVAVRQKLPNLMWLAGFFYATTLGDFFFNFVRNYALFGLGVGLGEIAMVFFIQKTFYQGRKSPYLIFMGIAVLFAAVDFILPLTNSNVFPYFSPFNWVWLIVVGNQAYKQIAADTSVEDWVKSRYKLIIAYSVLALFAPIGSVVQIIAAFSGEGMKIFANPLFNAYNYFVFVTTTSGIVIEYLAWVMPGAYMRWLNRKYQAKAELSLAEMEMSEEEILKQLQSN